MALTTPRDSSDKYDDEDEDDHGQQQRESTVNEKLNVSCSCSVEVIVGKVFDGKCWNVETVLKVALFCILLASLVDRTGNGADGRSLFGKVVTPSCAGRLFNFNIENEHGNAMKMSVVRKWQFYVVYDNNFDLFVAVAGVHRKPVQCGLCTTNST